MSEVKKYNAYAEGLTVHFELDSEGAWVAADDFDAQRLRADTAEAELSAMTEFRDNAAKKIFRMRAEITAAEQRIARMEAALKYYADKDHFSTDDGLNWDSCSGEPSNILWHEEQPWFIEDGSIARAALNPNPEAESHE